MGSTATAIADLEKEQAEVANRARSIIDDAGGNDLNPETRKELREMTARLGQIETELKDLDLDNEDLARVEAVEAAIKARSSRSNPRMYGEGSTEEPIEEPAESAPVPDKTYSPGGMFLRSTAYREWIDRFPEGGPSKGAFQSDPVITPTMGRMLGLRSVADWDGELPSQGGGMRTLMNVGDASSYPPTGTAGPWVFPQFLGLMEPGLLRPLTLRDVVQVMPATSDTIEYVKESSRTHAAAPVQEATALSGTSGTKPEGALAFSVVTAVVRTIAVWIPATHRVLADAPQLRAYIDDYLTYDIALELENQMGSGSGSGENFRGILNQSGIQTQPAPSGTLNDLDLVRRAMRLVKVNARTTANALLIHPQDAETLEELKAVAGTGGYFGGGPYGPYNANTLWGLPVIESEAVPQGTGLVGDFRKAILWDREATTISVGTANDDFIRNIIRILGEMRAAFGVLRPSAFVAITW